MTDRRQGGSRGDEALWEEAREGLRSIVDHVRFATSRLEASQVHFGHGTDNALDEAIGLVLGTLGLLPYAARGGEGGLPPELWGARVLPAEGRRILERLRRRIEDRVPLPYLLGTAWFGGLELEVSPEVLIPRSPIGELLERRFEPWVDPDAVTRILDVGTGSGALAIACALAFPEAQVDATDLSEDALAIARRNVERHGLGARVHLRRTDLLEGLEEGYDLIVSNPPYVPEERLRALPPEYGHEPRMALASGAHGIEHPARILRAARGRLRPGGVLVMEVGEARPALEDAFPGVPFAWPELERGGEGVLVLDREALPE